MRTSSLLTLALVPAALMAQTPAPLAFTETLKAQGPAIEQCLKDLHPQEALVKAESLLPAAQPAFNPKDVNTARASSFQFSDLARTYHLAGRAASAAGDWEKGLAYFIKAKEIAQTNLEQTGLVLNPALDLWKGALETARKTLDAGAARLAELSAKQPLSPREDEELRNFQVEKQNRATGEQYTRIFQQDLAFLRTERDAYVQKVESAQKRIAAEKAAVDKELATNKKLKGRKENYLAAGLTASSLEFCATKEEKIHFLYRLQFLSAGTPLAEKVQAAIERVQLDQDPFPVGKSSKKKTK